MTLNVNSRHLSVVVLVVLFLEIILVLDNFAADFAEGFGDVLDGTRLVDFVLTIP